MPRVNVPGRGIVNFPDTMSQAQILEAIKKLTGPTPSPSPTETVAAPVEAKPTPSSDSGAFIPGPREFVRRMGRQAVSPIEPLRKVGRAAATMIEGVERPEEARSPLIRQLQEAVSTLREDPLKGVAELTGIPSLLRATRDAAPAFVEQPVASARGFGAGVVEGLTSLSPIEMLLLRSGKRPSPDVTVARPTKGAAQVSPRTPPPVGPQGEVIPRPGKSRPGRRDVPAPGQPGGPRDVEVIGTSELAKLAEDVAKGLRQPRDLAPTLRREPSPRQSAAAPETGPRPRLAGRAPTVEDAIREALNELRTPERPSRVSLPPSEVAPMPRTGGREGTGSLGATLAEPGGALGLGEDSAAAARRAGSVGPRLIEQRRRAAAREIDQVAQQTVSQAEKEATKRTRDLKQGKSEEKLPLPLPGEKSTLKAPLQSTPEQRLAFEQAQELTAQAVKADKAAANPKISVARRNKLKSEAAALKQAAKVARRVAAGTHDANGIRIPTAQQSKNKGVTVRSEELAAKINPDPPAPVVVPIEDIRAATLARLRTTSALIEQSRQAMDAPGVRRVEAEVGALPREGSIPNPRLLKPDVEAPRAGAVSPEEVIAINRLGGGTRVPPRGTIRAPEGFGFPRKMVPSRSTNVRNAREALTRLVSQFDPANKPTADVPSVRSVSEITGPGGVASIPVAPRRGTIFEKVQEIQARRAAERAARESADRAAEAQAAPAVEESIGNIAPPKFQHPSEHPAAFLNALKTLQDDVARLESLLTIADDFDPADKVAAARSMEGKLRAEKARELGQAALSGPEDSFPKDFDKAWREIRKAIDVLEGNAGGETVDIKAIGRPKIEARTVDEAIGPPPKGVEPEKWQHINAVERTAKGLARRDVLDPRLIRDMRAFWGADEAARRMGIPKKQVIDLSGAPKKRPLNAIIAEMDARMKFLVDDPKGFFDTEALVAGGGATAGALLGGMIEGEDAVDRFSYILSSAIIGGGLGFAGARGLKAAMNAPVGKSVKSIPRMGEALDTSWLLSGPAMIKASLGSMGGVAQAVFERLQEGRVVDARRGLRTLMREAPGVWFNTLKAPTSTLPRMSSSSYSNYVAGQTGISTWPEKIQLQVLRPFIAADRAGQTVMQRMGYSKAEADRLMLQGHPTSWQGQALLNLINSNMVFRMLAKFARVRVVGLERAMEGLPFVPSPRSKKAPGWYRGFQQQEQLSPKAVRARKVAGTGALIAGTAYGYAYDPSISTMSVLSAISPFSTVAAAGMAAGKGIRRGTPGILEALQSVAASTPQIGEGEFRPGMLKRRIPFGDTIFPPQQ